MRLELYYFGLRLQNFLSAHVQCHSLSLCSLGISRSLLNKSKLANEVLPRDVKYSLNGLRHRR